MLIQQNIWVLLWTLGCDERHISKRKEKNNIIYLFIYLEELELGYKKMYWLGRPFHPDNVQYVQ